MNSNGQGRTLNARIRNLRPFIARVTGASPAFGALSIITCATAGAANARDGAKEKRFNNHIVIVLIWRRDRSGVHSAFGSGRRASCPDRLKE